MFCFLLLRNKLPPSSVTSNNHFTVPMNFVAPEFTQSTVINFGFTMGAARKIWVAVVTP